MVLAKFISSHKYWNSAKTGWSCKPKIHGYIHIQKWKKRNYGKAGYELGQQNAYKISITGSCAFSFLEMERSGWLSLDYYRERLNCNSLIRLVQDLNESQCSKIWTWLQFVTFKNSGSSTSVLKHMFFSPTYETGWKLDRISQFPFQLILVGASVVVLHYLRQYSFESRNYHEYENTSQDGWRIYDYEGCCNNSISTMDTKVPSFLR